MPPGKKAKTPRRRARATAPGPAEDTTHAPSVVISCLHPMIEGGRFPVKRVVGEPLHVEADLFKDGHDEIRALLKWRPRGDTEWRSTPMQPVDNDRWSGTATLDAPGAWEYTIEAWPDPFQSWKSDLRRRIDTGQESLDLECLEGAAIAESAARRAGPSAAESPALTAFARTLRAIPSAEQLADLLDDQDLDAAMNAWPDLRLATSFRLALPATAERERARFSAWYEFFPRSAKGHGEPATFRDCLPRLDDAAAMGFDVVYLPPVHPIGFTARKGPNNAESCAPGDPGSPWAIGSPHGGHRDVEPALGTLEDFDWLVDEARRRGLEIALDFAINCSPDHPFVRTHPNWFHQRPDGSIRYAENPPKKYQDIFPLDFHNEDWRNLWSEMRDIVLFWIDHGVRIFRVDNPHTKPVAFWEYLIAEVRARHPDILFLSEAFTRPKMMRMLAKVGFQQSYTYFTWRVAQHELIDYFTELTQDEPAEYFLGNLWPNTPDILPYHLMDAGPAVFKLRAALAATLSSSWGIYSGYEFCESRPLDNGKEEYLDSEKYQVSQRDWSAPGIRDFITALNRARHEHPALREYRNLRFAHSENDRVLAYCKRSQDGRDRILVVANLEPDTTHESTVHLPLDTLGLAADEPFTVEDLLTGESWVWSGSSNYVKLHAGRDPVHLFVIR